MALDTDNQLDENLNTTNSTKPGSQLQESSETIARAKSTLEQLEMLQDEFHAAEGDVLDFELPAGFLLSIVVPAYNEEKTINRVISTLFNLPIPMEVIAVDDGSTDQTCAILTRLNDEYPELKVAFQEKNQGKGAALRKGFSLATGTHMMVQDADLEYNPYEIPALLQPLAKDEADVVYGSRFMEQRWEGSSFIHRLGNRMLTEASNMATGLKLTDMETCYKIWKRDYFDKIELEQNQFGFEVELTAKLAKLKARIVERPISYEARGWEEGKKIGWKDAVQALYCICKYR